MDDSPTKTALTRLLPPAMLCILAVILVRTAWLGDDAYITFRSIDNLIHGYGLRWNVAERVQTFTHPLWLFTLSVPIAVTREFYLTPLAVSLICTLVAAWILAFRVATHVWGAFLGLVLLCVSKAFTDYASSGLENPLSYLLVALFFWVWQGEAGGRRRMLSLSLLAGLLALNRLDLVVLVLPALLVAAKREGWKRALPWVAAGFVPLALWEIFSLFYYGSLFPNTAYAKVFNNSLTPMELLKNGLLYFRASLRVDAITLILIAGTGVTVLTRGGRRHLPLVAGIVLYLFYVLRIGGDFMNGRFFSVPFFLAVCVLVHIMPAMQVRQRVIPFALIFITLLQPASPLRAGSDYGHQAAWVSRPELFREFVLDERGIYYPYTGLLKGLRNGGRPYMIWYEDDVAPIAGPAVVVAGRVGLTGFLGGPSFHVVDQLALTDPLLARLPAKHLIAGPRRFIGHYARFIPAGYLESLCRGGNVIENRKVAALYARIQTVTRGPLLSGARLREIVLLNLGRYNAPFDEAAWRNGEGIAEDKQRRCVPHETTEQEPANP